MAKKRAPAVGTVAVVEKTDCVCGARWHAREQRDGGQVRDTCLNTDVETLAKQKVADFRAKKALARDAEYHAVSEEEEAELRAKGYR
jgi:hypothetical protein